MIELDFTVPPSMQVGEGNFGSGHVVDVTVSASPAVFPDHDQFVAVKLTQGKITLAEQTRVPRTRDAIMGYLVKTGRSVGEQLDRELSRRNRNLRG